MCLIQGKRGFTSSKRNTCGAWAGLVILACLLVSAALSAQDRQSEQAVSAQQNPAAKPGTPGPLPEDFKITVKVPEVSLGVSVQTSDGAFVPGLKKENFRVLEDNVPQTITTFKQTQDPITAVILAEFTNNDSLYEFAHDSLVDSYAFAQTLRKEDWVGLISFDLKPHVLQDFTQEKSAIIASISMVHAGMAISAESNLRDALYETLDRLEALDGRKYVILVSTGRDSSSKKTAEQLLRKVRSSKNVAIYSITTGRALKNFLESRDQLKGFCPTRDASCSTLFNPGNDLLATLAGISGGKSYQPRVESGIRDAFIDIGQTIRNQYNISYHPKNRAQDGSYRKILVQLVDEKGQPLEMKDHEGKKVDFQIITREGYIAKREVE